MKRYVAIFFLIVIFCSGCTHPSQHIPEDSLKNRVEERMQAVMSGKWDVVYTYFDSKYRKAVPEGKFVHKPRNVKFKKYTIETLTILPSGKEADVRLKLDIQFQGYTFPDAPKKQHWVREKNEWYLKGNLKKSNPFSSSQTTPKK